MLRDARQIVQRFHTVSSVQALSILRGVSFLDHEYVTGFADRVEPYRVVAVGGPLPLKHLSRGGRAPGFKRSSPLDRVCVLVSVILLLLVLEGTV